jgi:RNA polymerase sigma-70 factor (ECF subfamily)
VTPDEIVIAVLPFTNINAEADTDGLCAGIAEAITGALVKLPGLRVRTYTQALQYSSQDMGSSDIGRQLGAEMVLEGSLQSIQGRVAVTIRLVKVGSSDAIWSERMVRDTQDVFALQEEVASQAVDGLRSELGFYRSPEALVVGFARTGDSNAFAELVKRRQSWIRNLMRRCCGDVTLADDLAQQVFFQAWRKISSLREANRFGPWLKRLAVNVWLQHSRANDALRDADDYSEADAAHNESTGISMDLNRALATLSDPVRLCIVLSYHEGMTHGEIADMVDLPLGTVKSHIRRGTQRLQELLSAYVATPSAEEV